MYKKLNYSYVTLSYTVLCLTSGDELLYFISLSLDSCLLSVSISTLSGAKCQVGGESPPDSVGCDVWLFLSVTRQNWSVKTVFKIDRMAKGGRCKNAWRNICPTCPLYFLPSKECNLYETLIRNTNKEGPLEIEFYWSSVFLLFHIWMSVKPIKLCMHWKCINIMFPVQGTETNRSKPGKTLHKSFVW